MASVGTPVAYTPDGITRQPGMIVGNITSGGVSRQQGAGQIQIVAATADIVVYASNTWTVIAAAPEDEGATPAAGSWAVV